MEKLLAAQGVYWFSAKQPQAEIQAEIDRIYALQKDNEFGDERYLLLFEPGEYALDLKVGYCTHVAGLGMSPDDVVIRGALRTEDRGSNALCNFWRIAENLTIIPAAGEGNRWAVSQAAPLRRVHVRGDLLLWDKGYSSGGFMADCVVDGTVYTGTQQQWYARNSSFGGWDSSGWSFVFNGCEFAKQPQGYADGQAWDNQPLSISNDPVTVAGKPFLVRQGNSLQLLAPRLLPLSIGADWSATIDTVEIIPQQDCGVVVPGMNAAEINSVLSRGIRALIFAPGVYQISEPLVINNPDTILLGLGLPVLVPENGNPVLEVNADGSRIAGIMIDAGAEKSERLVEINSAAVLSDVYFRVGGAREGRADCCLAINGDNVIGDNLWIWRADHGKFVSWEGNRYNNGIIVNGDNVTVYALAVEHFNGYQTIWNGNGGKVYFYQSEIPYDMPDQQSWRAGGYASYKVADKVDEHYALAAGVYSYFRDAAGARLVSAIEAPLKTGVCFEHSFTVWLDGQQDSVIEHVINNDGAAATYNNRRAVIENWRGTKKQD